MHLPFSLRGLPGVIEVTVEVTRDPTELGASPGAVGLPHCRAAVEFPGRGYHGLLGWIQMVRSTDNDSHGKAFEMDPLMFVGAVAHPFGFFGITPTLFDAPGRRTNEDLDWLCHSFLSYIKDFEGETRVVSAITGFSWGFSRTDGVTTVEPAQRLTSADWNGHLELLHRDHPGWRFLDDFEMDSTL
ncbi:hypothetical protein Q0Z83_028050 [Actinoplanes sichuanensis]|uniref:Uncharacterized protein n=1 Tax=Actinoplanes sichuanensis TaxID=512349 RepID=A0ABW4AU31_9ACTN|nr:hypothetical protein [Actinoplanes sichuanensis]BEL04614.1 hypothetical protein Q0Z83_028050 [Actinoplanes sichuanensis]